MSTTTQTPLRGEVRRLIVAWLCLVALGGAALATSFLPLPHGLRPLLLLPSAVMAMLVGIAFMEVKKGPAIVRAFALAGLFWLAVLLALGSVDPLTRDNHPIPRSSDQDPASVGYGDN